MSLQNIRRAIIKAQKLLFMLYFFFMPILRAPYVFAKYSKQTAYLELALRR
jgi:hypothetical protein